MPPAVQPASGGPGHRRNFASGSLSALCQVSRVASAAAARQGACRSAMAWCHGQGARRRLAAAAEQPFGPGPFARMAVSSLVDVSTYIFLVLPCPAGKGPTARPLGTAWTDPVLRVRDQQDTRAGKPGSCDNVQGLTLGLDV